MTVSGQVGLDGRCQIANTKFVLLAGRGVMALCRNGEGVGGFADFSRKSHVPYWTEQQ